MARKNDNNQYERAGVLREGQTSSRVWPFTSEFGRFGRRSRKSLTENWRSGWRRE